jgi:hypothetical protein
MTTDRSELIAAETLVTLIALARRYKSPRTGNTLHIASVRRWARVGIAGVRLGTVTVGATVYTSEQEFARWRQAVSQERGRRRLAPAMNAGRTAAQRERARLRAKAENDARRNAKRGARSN